MHITVRIQKEYALTELNHHILKADCTEEAPSHEQKVKLCDILYPSLHISCCIVYPVMLSFVRPGEKAKVDPGLLWLHWL